MKALLIILGAAVMCLFVWLCGEDLPDHRGVEMAGWILTAIVGGVVGYAAWLFKYEL